MFIIIYHLILIIGKITFLILGEGPTYGINRSIGSSEKNLVLILLKQPQNFIWVYIIMLIMAIWLLMGKKSLNLNLTIKM